MAKTKKPRIDEALVGRGLVEDLSEARKRIMAGEVLCGDRRIDKPGTPVDPDSPLRLKTRQGKFVSRGGLKLEGALDSFNPIVAGRIALDLGASTGGFTDCLLQRGAAKVYAVDVGTNQLDYRLRIDPRVVVLERTHAKTLDRTKVPDPIELLVADVSFTSLRYVLPHVIPLLAPAATGVCLFKPQFEVPRERVTAGGLAEPSDAEQTLSELWSWLQGQGLRQRGQMKSPVKGRDGNQEYLLWWETT